MDLPSSHADIDNLIQNEEPSEIDLELTQSCLLQYTPDS